MHSSSVSVAINKSSIYCNITPIPCGRSYCSKSLASWFPKRAGLYLNPCGNTAHVCCTFLLEVGFSHSNANNSWLSGLKGRQEKASFRSNMVNQVNSVVNLVRRVYGFATTGCKSATIQLIDLKSCTIQ